MWCRRHEIVRKMPLVRIVCCLIAITIWSAVQVRAETEELTQLSIEDLMDIQVTSVSKKSQSLSDSAAAVFVITSEDIRNSGATSIPELLRMAPGLNVARIDSCKWAISARGFNSRFSDKLLVLMDGRSVYSPFYSGVYWEVQDTILEDIERIEVIRGPGGTVWGANAVNGVINIITKHAGDTLGGLAVLGAGTEERAFTEGRYGTTLAEGIYGRFYGKGKYRDSFQLSSGEDAEDSWHDYRSGFKIDGSFSSNDSFTLQGDIYKGKMDQQLDFPVLQAPYVESGEAEVETQGGNILGIWKELYNNGSELELQLYYDHASREEIVNDEESDTLDFELKYHVPFLKVHDVIMGGSYRYISQDFNSSYYTSLSPESEETSVFSLFFQDEFSVVPDTLSLTFGAKVEHNEYTDYELQPSIRALYSPKEHHKLWGAIARAVRTPHRVERNSTIKTVVIPPGVPPNPLAIPAIGGITANPDFDSQEVLAYEAGYRFLASQNLSFDFALFYNDYDDLRTAAITPQVYGSYAELYNTFYNDGEGQTHGFELAVAWLANEKLKFDFAYSYIKEKLPDIFETYGSESPTNQFSVRANWSASEKVVVDLWVRYVDDLACMHVTAYDSPYYTVDDYITADIQVTYNVSEQFAVSLVGQNITEESHEEYVQEFWSKPTEVERGVYLKATYSF